MSISRHIDLPLQYVLSVPSGQPATASLPLVFVLHGRGADANDLADLAPMLDSPPGYRFLLPNAPRAWEAAPGQTFGFTWFDGWPPQGNSFIESRKLVLDFIDAAAALYPTPPGKIILSGFSQGALMALDVGFRTAQKIAGIVGMSGALFEKDMGELKHRKGTPVMIIHGTDDEVIPVRAARRTRRFLQENGIEPEYHEFPMAHHITEESMAVVARFVKRCLD